MSPFLAVIGGLLGGFVRSWFGFGSRLAVGSRAASFGGFVFNGVAGSAGVVLVSGLFAGVFEGLSSFGVLVFSLILGYCSSDIIDSFIFFILNPPFSVRRKRRGGLK